MSSPQHHTFTVEAPDASSRLDVYLTARVPGQSRSSLQRLIEDQHVRVDGSPSRAGLRLKVGQRVEVEIPPPPEISLAPTPMDLRVLYEDEHLLFLDKPAGLVVHPAPTVQGATLVHGLLAHLGAGAAGEEDEGDEGPPSGGDPTRPGIVHRLDRDTSGVMVVAKDEPTHRGLVDLFKVHEIARVYVALVKGVPSPRAGTWASEIGRSPRNRLKMASVKKGGRRAVTHYRVLEIYPGASLLELRLETGRTHQIRVHTSEAGHPVLADPVYGGHLERGLPDDAQLKAALEVATGQLLHARLLGLRHPVSGAWIERTSEPPADFLAVQARLRALAGRASS